MSNPWVPWTPEAENELARIWNDNPDLRAEITAAAAAIDRELSNEHSRHAFAAEPRETLQGVRVSPGFEPPLMVWFVIDPVLVYRVRLMRKPSRG
jgi:hypothetical protein